jgi:hypothetical protein
MAFPFLICRASGVASRLSTRASLVAVPYRSTSWIAFEQPNLQVYRSSSIGIKPTTASNSLDSTTDTTPSGRREPEPEAVPRTAVQNTNVQSCPAQIPKQRGSLSPTLTDRTKFMWPKSAEVWRDQYLPSTRICIPGVPASWGVRDDLESPHFSVPDELEASRLRSITGCRPALAKGSKKGAEDERDEDSST